MKHDKFYKRENMSDGCFTSHVERQTEMLRRKYSDYCLSQFVLWIVPDFFHNYTAEKITGVITITKTDGTELTTKQIIRTPYPNKMIQQISTTAGRKRVYGIPFVFDTFEELKEVKNIHIRWEVYSFSKIKVEDKRPFDLQIHRLDVVYHLNFQLDLENPNFRIFTIFSNDDILVGFNDTHDDDDYFDEFDISLSTSGVIELENDDYYANLIDINELNRNRNGETLSPREREIIDDFEKDLPAKDVVRELANSAIITNEVQYYKYFYERAEILTACELADILPESCFGFRDIT